LPISLSFTPDRPPPRGFCNCACRVSNQLEEGRMPSETILGAMKRNNQKNQTFHKQQVPWSHPNGADVGGGAQHPIEAPDVSRTPQQSAENGVWRHDKQEKKGTPGGAQKPRKPTSGAADWMVPSAKSKRVYPDECNGPFVVGLHLTSRDCLRARNPALKFCCAAMLQSCESALLSQRCP
jgi:hypothetical protein